MLKSIVQLLLYTPLLLTFSACIEDVKPIDQSSETFFKQYGTSLGDMNSFAGKTDDGYLMAGTSTTNDILNISKCNELGHLLWERDVPVNRQFYFPTAVQLKDGSLVINDEGNPIITKINSDGTIAYSNWFDPSLSSDIYHYSPLVESANGLLYVAYSGGASTSGLNRNYISEINPNNGLETIYYRYYDADFGGKIVTMDITKVEGNTFWVMGNLYDNSPWSWADPWKLYTAKITGSEVQDAKIYDTRDQSKQEEPNGSITTKDNGIVMITNEVGMWLSYAEIKSALSIFKVRKTDLNLEDIWERDINIGASSAMPISIEETANEELIIIGSCIENGKKHTSGFVARLSKNGDLIDSKIFNLGQPHTFYDAIFLPDNSYFFTGYIENFGNGNEDYSRFYLKTDKDFNY